MEKEQFDFIIKEIRKKEHTYEIIRMGMSSATKYLVHALRAREYSFLSSLLPLMNAYKQRMGVTESEMHLIFEMHELVVFTSKDVMRRSGCSIVTALKILHDFEKRNIIFLDRRIKSKGIYRLTQWASWQLNSFHYRLLRGAKIQMTSEYISKEVEGKPHLYAMVLEHNRRVARFKKVIKQAEEDMLNGDEDKHRPLCYKEF